MSGPHRAEWFYFGCVGGTGHYLFDRRLNKVHSGNGGPALNFDGVLCPPGSRKLYVAALARLGATGHSALAFWDCTIDSRPGSNSIIFAPSLAASPALIMRKFSELFPTIFQRWPPIDLCLAEEQDATMIRAPRSAPPALSDPTPARRDGGEHG